MTKNGKPNGDGGTRDARLKQALKANLARRKAQARKRSAGTGQADDQTNGPEMTGRTEQDG